MEPSFAEWAGSGTFRLDKNVASMKKYFYILNHPLCPTPYTHRFFVEKFASGFTYHGYEVKLISSPQEIVGPGVMMIYDAGFYFYWNDGIRNLRRDFFIIVDRAFKALKLTWFSDLCWHLRKKAIMQFAPTLKEKNVVLLGWFWFWQKKFFDDNSIKIVYTGEYFYREPVHRHRKAWWHFYTENREGHALPIQFAAAMDPLVVGSDPEAKRDIMVSFVGERKYKPDWQALFNKRSDCRIVPTPPYIPELERIDIYKRSLVSLGLEGCPLIRDGLVTERIFEALAYGAVCITNHDEAVEATNGAAVFAKDANDAEEKVKYFSADRAAATRQRALGFRFVKEQGTYAHQAGKFIALIEGGVQQNSHL